MAGGPITVTDRISVRVSAKTQEQSAANKKAVGGAIGKTLGNEDISDELKTQLGNTKNPVVYDEDGNAWISMEDIIAAGKAMNAAGAFEDPYKMFMYGNVTVYVTGSFTIRRKLSNSYYSENIYSGATLLVYASSAGMDGKTPGVFDPYKTNFSGVCIMSSDENVQFTIEDSQYAMDGTFYKRYTPDHAIGQSAGLNWWSPAFVFHGASNINDQIRAAYNAGPTFVEDHSGSLIDWTKTDAEIARDIQELHDTWDVTEHEGAVTANGTYILAGPIEFNPGD